MSISTTLPRQRYSGDGITTVFPVPFQFDIGTDLKVTLLDTVSLAETILVLGTHYIVTGGDMDPGSITLSEAPSATKIVSIVNAIAANQPEVLRENGPFPATTVEAALDRVTLIAQRALDLANRAPHFSDTDSSALDATIPNALSRANKFAAYGASGEPIASTGAIDGELPVSAIGESLVQASDAAAARTVIDAQQKTESLTATTAAPVVTADLLPLYMPGVLASRKITVDDLLKVINNLTLQGTPIPADLVAIYDSANSNVKKLDLAGVAMGAKKAGSFANLGLFTATGSVAGDTIQIAAANGTTNASNPIYVTLPIVGFPGATTVFKQATQVNILLTGAHGGRGTFGDFTDIPWYVYAINDNGTLKWGVSQKPNIKAIADTATSATPSSVNAYAKMLVNTALSSGTWPCRQVGWFLGDFDDTGGSSEDLWTVQTGPAEICVGEPAPFPVGVMIYNTPNGHGSTNTKVRIFSNLQENTQKAVVFASSAANGSSFTILEDGQYAIDYGDATSGSATIIGISKNSAQLTTSIATINPANRLSYVTDASTLFSWNSMLVDLVAGDVIRPHTDGSPNDNTTLARISIKKVRHAA